MNWLELARKRSVWYKIKLKIQLISQRNCIFFFGFLLSFLSQQSFHFLPSLAMSGRNQRVLVQPINVIFKHLQSGTRVTIWLYDNIEQRIEGKIIGFDEFMNVVIDDAEEVWVKDTKSKKNGDRNSLGRLLLKGENITLIQQASVAQS